MNIGTLLIRIDYRR